MNQTTLIAFILYLVVVVGIAIVAWFVTRNLSDFVLGGRRLSGAIAALSAGASDMSAWLLLGLPGAAYLTGIEAIWLPIGLTLGAYINWRVVAKPLRVYTEYVNDSLTIPAFLSERHHDTDGKIQTIAAISTLVFFAFYTAANLVAAAILIQQTFELSYIHSLWVSSAIIMAYTMIGGFLAVSWTDFFQGILMLICLSAVPFFAAKSLGGWGETLNAIYAVEPHFLEFSSLSFLAIINLLAWGLGYFGQPHILVRFMAVKSTKEIPIARRICVGWMSLSMLGAVVTGLVGIAYFHHTLENHETVFIHFSKALYHPWIAGCILAAILSSTMCAIDSQMLASSSALTEDIYHRFFRRHKASNKELVLVGRIAVILIGLVAIALAYSPSKTVLDLVGFAWAGLASTFAAPVVFSLFWKRTTRQGVLAGMLIGSITVVLWKLLGWSNVLYEIVPGIFSSSLGLYVVTLITPPPSEQIRVDFEHVQRLCREV